MVQELSATPRAVIGEQLANGKKHLIERALKIEMVRLLTAKQVIGAFDHTAKPAQEARDIAGGHLSHR